MPKTPHDSLFRFTFGKPGNAAALIRSNLPQAIVDRVDWASLRVENGSYVDTDAQWRHCDLVFSARIDDRAGFIYVLLEHQSAPDGLMPLRMLRYIMRLWDAWLMRHKRAKRVPAVVPLVVYHGQAPWTAPVELSEIVDLGAAARSALTPHLPQLRIVLDDLTARGESDIRRRGLPVGAALTALGLLGFPRRDAVAVLSELADLLRALPATGDGNDVLVALLCYAFEVARPEPDPEHVRAFFATNVGSKASEVVMSAAEKLREQGKIEGRAEGRAEGRVETLLKLLALKFGQPSAAVEKRVRGASMAQLDRLTERVLTAASMRELFADASAKAGPRGKRGRKG